MSAVWMRVRAEARGHWRAWAGLALLIGLASGASMASIVGARRTDTAYPRFLHEQRAADVVVSPGREAAPDLRELEAIRRLPQVEDSAIVTIVEAPIFVGETFVEPFTEAFPLVDPDGRFGVTFNKVRLTSGRLADPTAEDEVVATSSVARRLRIAVGGTLRMPRERIEGLEFGQLFEEGKLPEMMTLRVVGVGLEPGALEPLAGGYIPAIHLTPAFYRAHRDLISPEEAAVVVRLRRGIGDLDAFRAEAERRGIPLDVEFNFEGQHDSVRRSTGYQSVALWLLGALTALTAVAVLGQALARLVFLESSEYPTLRALGMSHGQLWTVGMVRAAAVALAGAAVGAVIAFALSRATTWGIARSVEPNPGLSFDGAVAGLGIAATLALVAAVSAVPVWRAARAAGGALGTAELPGARRPSLVAGTLARLGLPPSAVAGARMALEPGRGRTAVPVRTTIAGAAIAVLSLAAALGFSASLDHLLVTPGLTGWTWDAIVGTEAENAEGLKRALASNPAVLTASEGDIPDLSVNGVRVLGVALDPSGGIRPAIIDGRAPETVDEIALGPATLRQGRARIGGTVEVFDPYLEGGPPPRRRMRVVGTVAVPNIFFAAQGSGHGAAMTPEGSAALRPASDVDRETSLFVRFAPGTDRSAALRRLHQTVGSLFVLQRQESGEVADLRRVSGVPIALAAILALMGVATLAHTMVSSVRRRARELAVLKTLGFVRRQVGATVAWQATTLSLVALVVGVPLGIAAGRWAWRAFADQLAIVPEPIVPLSTVLLAIPAMIVLANLIAALPARAAARTRPAIVLRTE